MNALQIIQAVIAAIAALGPQLSSLKADAQQLFTDLQAAVQDIINSLSTFSVTSDQLANAQALLDKFTALNSAGKKA